MGSCVLIGVYYLGLMQLTYVAVDLAVGLIAVARLYVSEDIDMYFGLVALSSDGKLVRVRVIPYEESGLFGRIEIGLTASVVRNMTIYDYFGQKTVIEFCRFSSPSTFNDEEFTFIVPDDVDLVTQ